jgi:hypothetical protein
VRKAREAAARKEKPLRVMFQDEARFGRMGTPRACWAPKPVRPRPPMQAVRQYVHAFGAVSPADGVHDSLVLPCADTWAMGRFLREASRRHPGEYILMFMDQASWHKSKGLKIPPDMELAYLPPYSPELNPEEHVWDELREKHFGNSQLKSIKAVVDRLAEGLRCLEASPQTLKNMTLWDWM